MISRRTFLGATGAAALAGAGDDPPAGRKKLAVVTTVWTYRSHAWHMAERFLHGYPLRGKWHRPPFEVVSAYVDQTPDGDLSLDRAKEFGFKLVLHHVTDGYKVADQIAAAHVPCSIINIDAPGGKPETEGLTFANGAILDKAGVLVAFQCGW